MDRSLSYNNKDHTKSCCRSKYSCSITTYLHYTRASGTPPNWVNRAEISAATGGTDADSTPDAIVGNDNLVNPGDPDDNNVNGNGPSQNEDEDDSDPAGPQIIDIALAKTTVTPGST